MFVFKFLSKIFCCWKSSNSSKEELQTEESQKDEDIIDIDNHPGLKRLKELGLLDPPPPENYNAEAHNLQNPFLIGDQNTLHAALLDDGCIIK